MIGPDTLRRLDRLAGVPACALLTALRRVVGVFRPRARPKAIRRVLFVQLAESGSMVLADPALRELAARTGARLHCLTFAANRASLALTGTVSEAQVFVLRTDSARTLAADAWRFLGWVRRMRIDTVIDGELFSCLTAVLCLATGVRRRAGFHRFGGAGLYRGDLYTHPVAFNAELHMAQNYLLLAEAVLAGAAPPAPRVPAEVLVPRIRRRAVSEAELAAVRALLPAEEGARLTLVNPNASAMLPQRRWPAAHFEALVRELLRRHPDVHVLLIGGPEDRASTAALAAAVNDGRCTDVAGRFPLETLPALFALARVMVSNDSGPAHFAAVTDLPVVVLFGPETPRRFRPLGRATVLSAGLACSPCVHVGNQRRTSCRDNQCMQRIGVAEVLEAVEAVLGGPTARGVPLAEEAAA